MDPILRFCAVGRQIGYGVYLALDTLTVVCTRSSCSHTIHHHHHEYRRVYGGVLSRTDANECVQPDALGIRRSLATKKIQREAFRAWMAGLLFNIMASVYTLSQIKAKASSLDRKSGESAVEKKKLERYSY